MAARSALVLAALVTLCAGASAQTDPRQADLRLQLRRAEALERSGQLVDARAALEGLLGIEPTLPGVILAYERVCRRLGELDKTLPVVALAIRADPQSVLPRQVELRVLGELGRFDELREAGERWLEYAPRSDEAYREYAAALQRIGDVREAERVLRRGAGASDRPVAMASELADLFLDQGRGSEAAEQWVLILRSSADLGWGLINFKLRTAGRGASPAAAALLQLLSDDPDRLVERELAAIAAIYAGRAEEARRRAESLLDELETRERLAFVNQFVEVAAAQEQPGLVGWAYRQLLRDAPGDTRRWDLARQIVQADLTAGDTTAALEVLEGLLAETEPGTFGHAWASGVQVRLHAARGELEAAGQAFARYASRYAEAPDFPSLALTIAEANVRHGRLAEASAALRAVPLSGLDQATTARLSSRRGFLALYTGRYEEARAELEVAAATLTGERRGEVLRVLGFLRAANTQELEAVSAAHRAAVEGRENEGLQLLLDGLESSGPSAARPALLLWAGELAVEVDAVESADEVLRSIPRMYPNSAEAPVALLRLAEALAAAGRRSEAIEFLETLILDYPESALTPLGRRRLAELREEVPRS